MELQFHKTMHPCLQRVKWEVQDQEQTQEMRLTDGMPDIGRVLGAWGQVLLRSKEWRSGSMNLSGGVMVWVLYAPEDGTEPRSMEGWIPFQMKWDLPDVQNDGNMLVRTLLRSVDARSISARKLMVRVGVSCLAEALVPGEVALYSPGELPEDVKLLMNTYPMQLPSEAGEKPFVVDEYLPDGLKETEKIIYYTVQPELVEQKVMAGKVVFRGVVRLHILYRGEDGKLYHKHTEFPFSQFSELEGTFGPEATAQVCFGVTSLELDTEPDGQLHLKAGLVGQYVICDRKMIEVVSDAYSTIYPVKLQMEELMLPACLETQTKRISAEITTDAQGTEIADLTFLPDNSRTMHLEDSVSVALSGQFQMLYYDLENRLQCASPRWEGEWNIPADHNNQILSSVSSVGRPQGTINAGGAQLEGQMQVDAVSTALEGLQMVVGLEIGEADPIERPSLILQKAGNRTLWELAKSSRSTVEAIAKANDLQSEPDSQQILLIPLV